VRYAFQTSEYLVEDSLILIFSYYPVDYSLAPYAVIFYISN